MFGIIGKHVQGQPGSRAGCVMKISSGSFAVAGLLKRWMGMANNGERLHRGGINLRINRSISSDIIS